MKWQSTNRTANEGVLFVKAAVNEHGSIFHDVHQENDTGVDGFIELVHNETASGRLVAVQIKSGDSYLTKDAAEFLVSVDQAHLDYWQSYFVPVILVCYSPSKTKAAWIPICEYVENENYHGRTPIKSIRIPVRREFNVDAIDSGIALLASTHADLRILIESIDQCLAGAADQRLRHLSILAEHPASCDSRTTAFVARHLLFDKDLLVADKATRILAYHVDRQRWSWNPKNKDERALSSYASELCQDFTPDECRRLIERVDEEWFGGPNALGERVFDLLACCEDSELVLNEIAVDSEQPMRRRINAFYMLRGCDDAELLEEPELADDSEVGDVYREMYGRELPKGK